ncbi:MAG: hypothetical protein QM696_06275 [Steroidobacteraceae bacterium]
MKLSAAVATALLGSLMASAVPAQATKVIPTIPKQYAQWLSAWETGTWQVMYGGCVDVYWGCFKSQNSYNAGELPRWPLPLNAEAAAANKVVVDALGQGKSLFDPDSQCYPLGMPNRARSSFKFVAQPDRFYLILSGNEFRTIWMDGRPMPKRDPVDYSYNGDSIGHWENGTLVIETRNIVGENTAIAPNVPKSDNFWVIERWTPISADRIDLNVTFKDEERFTAPYSETLQLKRNPTGETPPQPMACIPGVGQRYQPNPETGELELSGPGMAPLEQAED